MTYKTRGRWAGLAFLVLGFVSANAGAIDAPSAAAAAQPDIAGGPTAEDVLPGASALARETFPRFLAATTSRAGTTLPGAAVKITISFDDGTATTAWVERVGAHGDGFAGRPMGQALALGDTLTFTAAEVLDWSGTGPDGRIYGNFTARAMMEVLPPHRAALIATTLSLDPYPAGW